MSVLLDEIQEGESVAWTITLTDEPPFDFMLCFWKSKNNMAEIAKFAYPSKVGFIDMVKDVDDYLCQVPRNNTIEKTGQTLLEVQFIRGTDSDFTEVVDYRTIVRSLSPLSK